MHDFLLTHSSPVKELKPRSLGLSASSEEFIQLLLRVGLDFLFSERWPVGLSDEPDNFLLLEERHHVFELVCYGPVALFFFVPQERFERQHVGSCNFFEGLLVAGFKKVAQRRSVGAVRLWLLVGLYFEEVGVYCIMQRPTSSRGFRL